MATFDIVIGNLAQPDSGFDIVIGDAVPQALLDFTVPSVLDGIVMLILVLRDENEVMCNGEGDKGWVKVIDGEGTGDVFLDAWQRTADGTDGSIEGDVISFLSQTQQELQGGLVTIRRALPDELVYQVTHGAFLSDSAPTPPAVEVVNGEDQIISVFSAEGTIDFTAEDEDDVIDEYGSSVFDARSLFITAQKAGEAGEITPPSVTASPAASGRAFAIAIRCRPRITNPSGHAARSHPTDITNPSGHARRM